MKNIIKITVPNGINKNILSKWIKANTGMWEKDCITFGQIKASVKRAEDENHRGWMFKSLFKSILKNNPSATISYQVEFVGL